MIAFALRHDLFLVSLCFQITVWFSEQLIFTNKIISKHIFKPNGGYHVYVVYHSLSQGYSVSLAGVGWA